MARPRRRRGVRMYPCQPVLFESSEHRGSATLSEVSYSGARLEVEQAGAAVGGELIRINVWPTNHAEPFELTAHVVGVREGGFAVEYEEPGQAICQWVDALQTAESAPPRKPAERSGVVG